jgi:MoaA/NifB/PqqE/SkfB family radical SAM enzyme
VSFTGSAILQLHPTRRCNLRCLHCYSNSSPDAEDELPREIAVRVVEDAALLGYDVVSVSGGEPLMYRDLATLLAAAKAIGMRTQLVSNGLAITEQRLDDLAGVLDLLAVSLDGTPDDHDRMRALPGAFRRLEERLVLVRSRGIPFGLVFTLTMWNAHQIEWAVDFALQHGAQLLQVHPLDATGRAVALAGDVPDETEAAAALLECLRLQNSVGDRLAIQVDVVTASRLQRMTQCLSTRLPRRISEIVSPLVVEPDGICVPLEYGFPRDYALGDVRKAALSDLAAQWMDRHLAAFTSGMACTSAALAAGEQRVVVSGYARMRETFADAPASVTDRSAW